ncbi:unnamed protein product [Pleuronectes platessa]|uniref:Uncharacterized protein n=1 Tax=Pleuronectes platessa TaxID=8262 RepID=A0A9N7W1I7_PLEPL|nr:unnamed protein product [Pleuronectes platessa]
MKSEQQSHTLHLIIIIIIIILIIILFHTCRAETAVPGPAHLPAAAVPSARGGCPALLPRLQPSLIPDLPSQIFAMWALHRP